MPRLSFATRNQRPSSPRPGGLCRPQGPGGPVRASVHPGRPLHMSGVTPALARARADHLPRRPGSRLTNVVEQRRRPCHRRRWPSRPRDPPRRHRHVHPAVTRPHRHQGLGIVGMRERIAAFGGQLTAEPIARSAPATAESRPGVAAASPPASRSRVPCDHHRPGRRRSGAACARFSSLIDAKDNLHITGQAADGRQAVERLPASPRHRRHRRPHAHHGRHRGQPAISPPPNPNTRVLILTTFDLDEYVFEACASTTASP